MSSDSKIDTLLRLARRGPLRSVALENAGIPRAYLTRLVRRGELEKIDRGLYRIPDPDPDQDDADLGEMAAVSVRVPRATLCLLTAGYVHGLVRRQPEHVWLMLGAHDRRPKLEAFSIELVRATGRARTYGLEKLKCRHGILPLTTPAKTVADCFRYRRRVGLEVAVAALRRFLSQAGKGGKSTDDAIEALVLAAGADGVISVLRPYLPARARQVHPGDT